MLTYSSPALDILIADDFTWDLTVIPLAPGPLLQLGAANLFLVDRLGLVNEVQGKYLMA